MVFVNIEGADEADVRRVDKKLIRSTDQAT
jgi:hypothetical protein